MPSISRVAQWISCSRQNAISLQPRRFFQNDDERKDGAMRWNKRSAALSRGVAFVSLTRVWPPNSSRSDYSTFIPVLVEALPESTTKRTSLPCLTTTK
jgi:hypothetical protein